MVFLLFFTFLVVSVQPNLRTTGHKLTVCATGYKLTVYATGHKLTVCATEHKLTVYATGYKLTVCATKSSMRKSYNIEKQVSTFKEGRKGGRVEASKMGRLENKGRLERWKVGTVESSFGACYCLFFLSVVRQPREKSRYRGR